MTCFMTQKIFLFVFFVFHFHQIASHIVVDPIPCAEIKSPCPYYTLVNSVECHPRKNPCCVTYSHSNNVILFNFSNPSSPYIQQKLNNPLSKFRIPQHAIFSADGQSLVIVNWLNQNVNVYHTDTPESYFPYPFAMFSVPS